MIRQGNKPRSTDCKADALTTIPSLLPISDRVERASVTEAVDSGSIPGRVKPKTINIGIHNFPAWGSAIKGTV